MKKILYPVLLLAVIAGGIGTARGLRRQSPRFQPFTVTYRVEDRALDGTLLNSETQVKWQSRNGAFHETRDATSGSHSESFGEPGRGVIVQKGDRYFSLSGPYAPQRQSLAEWRNSPSYVRDDVVLGVPVVVIESRRPEPDAPYSVMYLAPSLGGLLMRHEIHQPTLTTITEIVSLDLQEPTRAIPPMPDVPAKKMFQ